MTTSPETTHAATVTHTIAASPTLVFAALTDPEHFARWIGPEGSSATVLTMKPEPGGDYAVQIDLSGGGPTVVLSGAYRVVDRPDTLELTWGVGDEHRPVRFALHRKNAGTELTVVESGYADESVASSATNGWDHQLDRLTRYVESIYG